jgi:glutamine synthetase
VGARHIHVSLRDSEGKNIFAFPGSETGKGREGAKYDDTKFISEVAEYFLAGILDGLPDGEVFHECTRWMLTSELLVLPLV